MTDISSLYELDHIGIAVQDLKASTKFYEQSFGLKVDNHEVIESQGVELVFLKLANTKLELLAPTTAESTLKKYLDKRGPGIHHLCYRVEDIRLELARLEKLGFQLIDKKPRHGAYETEIAFIHPKSTQAVLTELCQYPSKASVSA